MTSFDTAQTLSTPPQIEITMRQTAVKQLGKGQDRIRDGVGIHPETGERFEWILVLDGHGTNNVINIMDNHIDWDDVVIQPTPAEYLNEKFIAKSRAMYTNQTSSDCTFSLVRIYDKRIETFMVGDSKIAVLIDDQEPIVTKPHNYYDKEEMERIHDKLVLSRPYQKDVTFEMVSGTSLCYRDGYSMNFRVGSLLAISQAFGHNNKTGLVPRTNVIPITSEQTINVIIASDGYWDMHFNDESEWNDIRNMTADELVEKTTKRWQQDWFVMYDKENPTIGSIQQFANGADDVAIGIWRKIGNA